MGRLHGKVALITGTAGGMGRAAALLFAAEGARVAGCDLKVEEAAETLSLVRDKMMERGGGGRVSVHHADVVGSLLAPQELAEVMLYALAREVTPKERRELQDRAIDEALAMQERGGVDVVTDGELRRIQFFDQFVVGIDGLAPGPGGSAKFHSDDGQTVEFRVPVCVQSRIKATRNLALEEFTYIKDKIRRAVHLCRGNYAGMWTARGGYEDLARSCFGRAPNVDVWMMEYDDDRSGGFEPLRELPADKTAVLGLITTKRPALEDPDRLRTRIEEAAEFHPREQLGISTQCGFESGTNAPLRLGEQEAKLSLVADIAHSVWAGARR